MNKIDCHHYSVYVGEHSLEKLKFSSYSKIAILVDENTKKYCLDILLQETKLSANLIICIDSGESHKTISTCQKIWHELTASNFDRNSLLINLGGGVICDMGGFAASCYKRGIDFIHIPTTLLAMVDASVGGKLGIDFSNLKNQIGLFNHPQSVLIYPSFLQTLEKRQWKSGFAEIIKHALIYDNKYWKTLLNKSFDTIQWESTILKSIQIKNDIVSNDFKESGIRKILNFGHTIGHAIESYFLSQGKDILHGEAVACGILQECKLSNISHSEKMEIKKYIDSIFPEIKLPDFDAIMPFIVQDKKNQNGKLLFSLLTKIGKCEYNCEVRLDTIRKVF